MQADFRLTVISGRRIPAGADCLLFHLRSAVISNMSAKLPHYVRPLSQKLAAPTDACFVPRGFLFPETRADLDPYREFPLSEPYYVPLRRATSDSSYEDILLPQKKDDDIFDSTILQISDRDEVLLEVQATGIQYCVHAQMCLRDDVAIHFPKTWDKTQALLVNIPVFSEEFCQWYYPFSCMGYNIANTDPPLDIDVARNYPQLFGYLPNGDLAIYWEIGEALAEAFDLELEPIRATVDGHLVLMPGVPEAIKRLAPAHGVVETGVIVSPQAATDEAEHFAMQMLGERPMILRHAMYQFYRLRLPVYQCELEFNPYAEATWGAFGFTCTRLAGFEFKIINNPFTRRAHIFATEHGNVVVSLDFYEALKAQLRHHGTELMSRTFPIQRIP